LAHTLASPYLGHGPKIRVTTHVVPYFRPLKRPLNYLEYKKDSNTNVHIEVFKSTIKANGEMINEEITNLFDFR
jgi:hypothetical protein